MKTIMMAIGIALLAGGCLSGNTSGRVDRFNQNSPNQSDVRSGASVSPRSEVEGNVYSGNQIPGSVYGDTVLEPMRSITTRPMPDASEEDASSRYDHRTR